MLPVIQIGPLAVQAPGLFVIAGIYLGLTLAEKLAPRFHSAANDIDSLTFIGLIAGLLGARLSYIAQHSAAFIENPLNIFSLNPGLLDPFGGAAVALLAALIYANRKKLALWPTLDALTPLLAVALIGIHLSNFASGKAFGAETDLPWGIFLWGKTRHPTQLYDLSLAVLIVGWLWFSTREGAHTTPRGVGGTFWRFLALSAGARLFTEAFRGDSALLFDQLRAAQIVAWLVLAISLARLYLLENPHATEK